MNATLKETATGRVRSPRLNRGTSWQSLAMLFLLPTSLLSFASQPGSNDCSVIQDTCDGCTETGPGDSFISFLNLEQFHSK